MATILSTSSLHPRAVRRLETVGTLRIAPDASAETLIREARKADVIIVRDPLPDALFMAAPRLRAVIRHGAGLDMIPVDAATAAGVLVANVPGVNAQSVAEHVVLVTLALIRHLPSVANDLRCHGWHAGRAHASSSREIAGRTLGLIGTGHVGRAVHAIVSAGFRMRVLGHTRSREHTPPGIEYRDLDDLLAESDVVVVACPLTRDTRGLLDADRLARMKSDALLVNVSRGAVIEDEALMAALRQGTIGGAALDVFTTQPLPSNDPYLEFDNVVLTPHVAGITDDSMERMGLAAAEAAVRILSGKIPDTLVNHEVVDHYRKRQQLSQCRSSHGRMSSYRLTCHNTTPSGTEACVTYPLILSRYSAGTLAYPTVARSPFSFLVQTASCCTEPASVCTRPTERA